jgi:hypothetical protein
MSRNIENIDRYLKGVVLPEHESHLHRQQLRREVLGKIERRQTMSVTGRSWKVAAVIAVVIGAGAIAMTVGLRIYRYHFEGQGRDGEYIFTTEPEVIYETPADANNKTSRTIISNSTMTSMGYYPPNGVTNPTEAEKVEQMQQDLEEIDQLRQRDERELTGVTDSWINGRFHRTCHFRYTLADGRIINMGEGDPDLRKRPTPEQSKLDHAEIELLRAQGQRELVRITESDVEGYIFRTCSYEYTLTDGRTKTVGESDPDPNVRIPVLSPEQNKEVWRLRSLKQGEYLGDLDREINGHIFSCETYLFTLADGTVVTHAVGERKDRKIYLTDADREELRALMMSGAGELLEITEREVRGQKFRFERRRYILSDGTEVIKSIGRPSEDSQNAGTTVDIDPKEADQTLNDKREIAILRQQDKRKLIAVDELTANGELDRRVFVYQYQLSDGRTKDLREGDELNTIRNKKLRGDEVNFILNKKQRQEWVQLKNTGSGEDIGTYEQKVKELLFVFKKQRFVLSDGTEIIWSYGTLKDYQ